MNIESTICVSKSDLMDKSDLIMENTGATMEEETGETNMNSELRIVTSHRLLLGQFLGLSGSFGPFQHATCRIGIREEQRGTGGD